MNEHYYVYRQPESIEELKQLLLLRYTVCRQSRIEKFIVENDAGIDLDCYDVNAYHFGLFEHVEKVSRPVGYVRMITDHKGPLANHIRSIASEVTILEKRTSDVPTSPFPLLTCSPDATRIFEFYKEQQAKGAMVIEVSRLSLERSARGLRVASHMVGSTFAAGMVYGVGHALMFCHVLHEKFYHQYGFERFRDTTDFYTTYHSICLTGSPERLSEAMHDSVLQMAEAYDTTGRICLYPNHPGQYFSPTESYVFSRPLFTAIE
jgi:hypothetical protein